MLPLRARETYSPTMPWPRRPRPSTANHPAEDGLLPPSKSELLGGTLSTALIAAGWTRTDQQPLVMLPVAGRHYRAVGSFALTLNLSAAEVDAVTVDVGITCPTAERLAAALGLPPNLEQCPTDIDDLEIAVGRRTRADHAIERCLTWANAATEALVPLASCEGVIGLIDADEDQDWQQVAGRCCVLWACGRTDDATSQNTTNRATFADQPEYAAFADAFNRFLALADPVPQATDLFDLTHPVATGPVLAVPRWETRIPMSIRDTLRLARALKDVDDT